MDESNWIMSYGGPLICVECENAPLWGGNLRLTVEDENASSDYERPGYQPSFLKRIALREGAAIIITEGTHDTSFWRRPTDDKLFIVQIICCELDFNIDSTMDKIDDNIFSISDEILDFDFRSPHLVIFDSVEEGGELDKKSISASISPGRYKILSKSCDLDGIGSLILHRFDKVI